MRELLAAIAHSQWSGWMRHMFNKGKMNPDGTWTMPKWAVDRWTHQMNLKYDDLTEAEKESDRREADKFIEVMK